MISRSALLEELKEQHDYIMQDPEVGKTMKWCEAVCFHRTVKTVESAPAVDAETVFKQIGLVKEAFEMAKADLMQVVQCKDCLHWETTKCPLCIVEFSELPDGKLRKHVIHNFVEDDFWCKKGERRSNDAADDADTLLDRR